MGNSFGYLNLAGTREFVAALAGAIRPGGGLVIDFTVAAESLLPGYSGELRTMRTGDIVVVATNEYDVAGSRLISGYHFTRGAEELRGTAIHHVYTSAQLGHLLADDGFTDIGRYGGPAGEPSSRSTSCASSAAAPSGPASWPKPSTFFRPAKSEDEKAQSL